MSLPVGHTLVGRRLPVVLEDGTEVMSCYDRAAKPKMTMPERPGDYCGPLVGYTGDKPSVFFLKPHARDEDTPVEGRGVQHVASPPHTFHEQPDGTLTIRNSIAATKSHGKSRPDGWHGYLEAGVWRKVGDA